MRKESAFSVRVHCFVNDPHHIAAGNLLDLFRRESCLCQGIVEQMNLIAGSDLFLSVKSIKVGSDRTYLNACNLFFMLDHLDHIINAAEPVSFGIIQESRHEVQTHDPASLCKSLDAVIGQVPGMIADGTRIAVRSDERHLRNPADIIEAGIIQMRDIHQHADVLHMLHCLNAEWLEAFSVDFRVLAVGIAEAVLEVPCQS